jgi:cytochrome c oxidase subunit 2
MQSALHPQGPHAEAVANLGATMFWGGAAVALIVFGLAAYALWGPRKRRQWVSSGRFIAYGGIVFPAVVLTSLFAYSLTVARSVLPGPDPADLRIEIVAYQWWWRVHYLDASGKIDVVTANELRIPTGRPVELLLRSADVIHSFWVPSLAGKLDVIPGRVNRLRVTASRKGVFRGQCAEYCGGPHAQMAFYVFADAAEDFDRWLATQRTTAAEPRDPTEHFGRTIFLQHCSTCHTVRGTTAEGTLGPDLTHLASRASIAAGILPNNRANIAAWIGSSQDIKPGNLMPSMNIFSGEELRALAAYMSALE